jgi:hypothetical protein
MLEIFGAFGAKASDIAILGIALLNIHKDSSRLACHSDGIAIATRVTMSFVFVIQLDIAIFVRPPLHLLPQSHCPF